MKSTPTADIVRDIVLANPFLVDYLRRNLINIASLSRDLLPLVAQHSPKATVESIAVAIQRLDLPTKTLVSNQLKTIAKTVQLNLRSDITLLHMEKGCTLPKLTGDDILFTHQGIEYCTIIIDTKNVSLIKGAVHVKTDNLGIITVKDTTKEKHNYRVTPGFVYLFLGSMSRQGINIVDLFTGIDTVNFVVKKQDLVAAYEQCSKAKEAAWL
jgi:hypothetical protein